MSNRIKVFSMYDTACQTWNVMKSKTECLYHGAIEGLEDWLENHKDTRRSAQLILNHLERHLSFLFYPIITKG